METRTESSEKRPLDLRCRKRAHYLARLDNTGCRMKSMQLLSLVTKPIAANLGNVKAEFDKGV